MTKKALQNSGNNSLHNYFDLCVTDMADTNPALIFAQYKIKEKVGMTSDLLLGSEIQQLAFKPLPTVNLAKEYQVSL